MKAANAQELLTYLQSKAPTDDTPIEIRISFSAGGTGHSMPLTKLRTTKQWTTAR